MARSDHRVLIVLFDGVQSLDVTGPLEVFAGDGDVMTSAGVTSGIDAALALVEEDAGREVALAVARHVDRVRLETARRLLEESGDGVEVVARACGYGTPEAMRRAFLRALGVPPLDAGSPQKAPAQLVETVRAASRELLRAAS